MSELSFIHWKVLVERDCVFQFYMIHHPPLISSKLLTPRRCLLYRGQATDELIYCQHKQMFSNFQQDSPMLSYFKHHALCNSDQNNSLDWQFAVSNPNFQWENSLKLSSLHWLDSCLLFAEVAADLERNWKLYFRIFRPGWHTVCSQKEVVGESDEWWVCGFETICVGF